MIVCDIVTFSLASRPTFLLGRPWPSAQISIPLPRMLLDLALERIFRSDVNPQIGKSKVINKAIQDIGLGWYNWQLFALCGFGWFADKLVFPTFPYRLAMRQTSCTL